MTVVPVPAAPMISAINPPTVPVGTPGVTLTVTGTAFVGSSRVQVDGSERATTLVSPTQLTAELLAADLASGGTRMIRVVTPAPGGGTSNALTLTVVGPTLAVDVTIAPLNGPVRVTFSNGRGGTDEWVGLFPAGSSGPGPWVDWLRMTGTQSTIGSVTAGTLTFPHAEGPPAYAAGTYVFRWISGGVVVAESGVVELADIPPPPVID